MTHALAVASGNRVKGGVQERLEPFKGVDAFTSFFGPGNWDKIKQVLPDLAHGWSHWCANLWAIMSNSKGLMHYKVKRATFEHDIGHEHVT